MIAVPSLATKRRLVFVRSVELLGRIVRDLAMQTKTILCIKSVPGYIKLKANPNSSPKNKVIAEMSVIT